jgi:hypothetical protein
MGGKQTLVRVGRVWDQARYDGMCVTGVALFSSSCVCR